MFVFIIPPIMLYTSGYRLGPNFSIVETGGMYIYSPEPGSTIYINSKNERETSFLARDWFVQDVTPGTYTVLIAKDGFWPWIKEVAVEERRVAEAIAFLIPKEPEIAPIPKTLEETAATGTTTRANPAYAEARALFAEPKKKKGSAANTATATTTERVRFVPEVISPHGRVGLAREGDRIVAYWLKDMVDLPNYFCRGGICTSPAIAFSSVVPIRSFDFYPGRDDVILIAVQNGIFAVEIDARKTQNFQPIYKGTNPDFRFGPQGFVVRDGDTLAIITL